MNATTGEQTEEKEEVYRAGGQVEKKKKRKNGEKKEVEQNGRSVAKCQARTGGVNRQGKKWGG